MWGDKAFALIKELDRAQETFPPFDDDSVRLIIEECKVLNQYIEEIMSTTFDAETNNFMAGVKVRQAAIERNKRCLLAYLHKRLERLKELRWEFGSILPPEIKANLSESEVQWFAKYNKALAFYMKTVGGKSGLDLTQNVDPPKQLYIEVRCLTDYGKLELDDGEIVMLNRNSQHLLPRSICEPLIRQGILQHII